MFLLCCKEIENRLWYYKIIITFLHKYIYLSVYLSTKWGKTLKGYTSNVSRGYLKTVKIWIVFIFIFASICSTFLRWASIIWITGVKVNFKNTVYIFLHYFSSGKLYEEALDTTILVYLCWREKILKHFLVLPWKREFW